MNPARSPFGPIATGRVAHRDATLRDLLDADDQHLRTALGSWLLTAGPAIADAPLTALRDLVNDASDHCTNPNCGAQLPPWQPAVSDRDGLKHCDDECAHADRALLHALPACERAE